MMTRRLSEGGPGIDPDAVPRLFSIARPMVSSKQLRLPTRGALGNGLRVVAGAVLASDGSLTVTTRNRRTWQHDRNASHTKANWHFTTPNARIKLRHLYPSI